VTLAVPDLHEERLGNGATVVVAARPGVPLVAARLFVRAGSALDGAGKYGLAHMVSVVARRGAGRRAGPSIDALVESLGADLGGDAEEDATVYGLSAPVEALPTLLGVLVDVVAAPTFPAGEFERLRRRELASLARDSDEPGVLADRAMLASGYGEHPYGHAVEGRLRDLRRVRLADVRAFHRRWYGPANATLVVVGPLSPADVLGRARRTLGRWRATAETPAEVAAAALAARRVVVVDKPDATQTQIRIAGAALWRASPDYFPAVVANAVLGGGFTSRMVEAIRVNRGLSYGVRTRFAMSRSAGLFTFSSFTKNETAGELVEVALAEMSRFVEEGATAEEVARATAYLAGLFPLSLETHDQWADRLCDARICGYGLDEVRDYRERVRAVSVAEVRDVARRQLPVQGGVILAVGPAKDVARQLDRFGPLHIVPARSVL